MLPTFGVVVFTVLVTAKSACWPVTAGLDAVLLPGVGSVGTTPETVAVLITALVVVDVAVIVSVLETPLLKAPTVQTPVPLTYLPCVADEPTKVKPEGNTSVTAALVTLLGPLLVKVIV